MCEHTSNFNVIHSTTSYVNIISHWQLFDDTIVGQFLSFNDTISLIGRFLMLHCIYSELLVLHPNAPPPIRLLLP